MIPSHHERISRDFECDSRVVLCNISEKRRLCRGLDMLPATVIYDGILLIQRS